MSFRRGRLVEVGKQLMRDIEGRMMKKSVCSSSDHSLLDKWHLHTDLESLGVPEIQMITKRIAYILVLSKCI